MIQVTGVKAVIRAIGKAKKETGERIEDGIRKICEIVRQKAYVYCPKETGTLANTGTIFITGKGFGCKGHVVFGGPEAHYAIYVHEDLTKLHRSPTQAKFLERAYREARLRAGQIMQRTLIHGTYRIVEDLEDNTVTETEI
jgi:hypothetical protein